MSARDYKGLRIVFMGTPEFAVPSLSALLDEGCTIAAVITAPDKEAGRGMKLQQSAVKKFALEKGLNVLQPEKLKSPSFLDQLKEIKADIQVVVAFRMLPEAVWNMPPLGTINLHASLLPQYRGAAPINWAIINGEKQTGVTTFRLQQEIDTGGILLQKTCSISETETAGELHDKLKTEGAWLLVQTIKGIADGTLQEIPQDTFQVNNGTTLPFKTAPKIFTEHCRINWEKPLIEIYNLVRGLSPYPSAFTILYGKKLKIYNVAMEPATPKAEPGSLETDNKTFLKFAAADGYLLLLEVQLEGKKKMPVAEFLKGFRFNN